MSLFSKIVCSIGMLFLNLELIFNLPTAERSYRSSLKNKFLKRRSAVSIVGGSPGLKILNTSKSASSLDRALSSCNVFLMEALISTLSIFNISIFDNF